MLRTWSRRSVISCSPVIIRSASRPCLSLRVPFLATPFLRHRNRFLRVSPFLEALTPSGKTYLRESVQSYIRQTKEPGVVVLVSDFLTRPAQYEAALLFLIARGL